MNYCMCMYVLYAKQIRPKENEFVIGQSKMKKIHFK